MPKQKIWDGTQWVEIGVTRDEITVLSENVGSVSGLNTTSKEVVGAVNEVKAGLAEHKAENVSQAHEPILQGYSEITQTSSGTGTVNLNAANGNVFNITLTGNTDFTLSPTDNNANSITLILKQGATARTTTFPASVKWSDGDIPDLSEVNKTYILTFVTVDGGVTWFGFMAGEF